MKSIAMLRCLVTLVGFAFFLAAVVECDAQQSSAATASRPNILWITIEDWSPDLSCYGTPGIHTPHVDRLAEQGMRFELAFTTAPVCSASRSAMMTGFHQNYIGANQHRENNKQALPYGIKPIPQLLQEAGYYTALLSRKIDCNFLPDKQEELFMGKDWKDRLPGQPFFARITFGGTHRPWKRDAQRPIEMADVALPPYYADTSFIRRDWANGLEAMQIVDRQVGELLQRLDAEVRDNTLVIFIADHGQCHIRGKQFLYDAGIRIPMILRWPDKIAAGQVNTNLVSTLDLCATVLEVAGVVPPVALHGQSLFSSQIESRKYIFAARDKMDETHDAMRAIRSRDFKLIQNLMPERAWCQYNNYKEGAYPALAEMNLLHMQGKLTPQQAIFFAKTKPEVELFDLQADPYEMSNLADDPKYAAIKAELLDALGDWRKNVILDQGVTEEFRGLGVFPENCPTDTVDAWVVANAQAYDYKKHGWPSWYPTRTQAAWQQARDAWTDYVFRGPADKVPRPAVTRSEQKKSR